MKVNGQIRARCRCGKAAGGRVGTFVPWIAVLLAFAAMGRLNGARLAAAQEGASENQVKAAYLYNFAKFAEWPEQNLPNGSSPLVVGVMGGDDDFFDALKKTVAGKSVGMHPLVTRRIDNDNEIRSCHLIFIGSSVGRKRTQAAIAAAAAGILLVGEDEVFLKQGGMINLFLKSGTVHFEVDRGALTRAGVSLGSALLALASGDHASPASTGAASGGDARKLKVSTPPEYPDLAQKMNIKGTVQAEVMVNRDGTVKEVRVLGGHPVLADAFVKAVMKWQYEPAAKDSVVTVKFAFGQ